AAGLVQVTPCSTNVDITRRGLQTLFRMCAHDGTQGKAAARYAASTLKARRIFVLDDKTTYGQGLAGEFVKAAAGMGCTIVGRDSINQGEMDFNALLTVVKAKRPQAIFFGGMYPQGALIAKQARELGVTAVLLGGDGLFDKTLIQLAGPEAAEGVTATMVGVNMGTVASAREFVGRYEAAYGPIGPYSPYAYDAVRLVAAAIARAGKAERPAVLAAVRATKAWKGVTGVTTFDAAGDTLNQVISVYTVRKGEWTYQGLAWGKL
ncbi:MAG: branched-chain amino acid ABC transporter substrate-binding protein, partial [bacterium]